MVRRSLADDASPMPPRIARLELPGVPLHVIQRGVNRCPIFRDDRDRLYYRKLLRIRSGEAGVAIHAFVLMGNHVHLLLSAGRQGAISSMMRRVGQAYAQAFNQRHGRTGALWQGRFKSSLVETERYLLNVMRYIELNPVRAGIVERAENYRWSSVHKHLGFSSEPMLTPHFVYLGLGKDADARAACWRNWLSLGTAEEELETIRNHAAQECALGGEAFVDMVTMQMGRPAGYRPRGRPRKKAGPRLGD